VLWTSPATAALTSDSSCITLANGELGGRTRYSNNVLKEIFCDLRAADYPVDKLLAASTEDRPELFLRAQSCSSQGVRMNSFTIRRLDRDMRETPDLRRLYGLTKTEQQIVREMLKGRSVAEIAVELHKSVLTVRTHVKRIYTKLNVGTKEQLFSSVMKLMID
jgi:DNA-binding CsgD family transcriptional regulator